MTLECTRVLTHPKPWGVADLRPWYNSVAGTALIGELSFERSDSAAEAPALLLKLLFTSAPLSIQVHPDDDFAQSIGLPNGKSEAWHVLEAGPGAKVALGLNASLSRQQLGDAIADGSIADRVRWRSVKAHDTIAVPAGAIHAIGADVIIAEIQQRSDATFRLFDHGRTRDLHLANGAAAAHLGLQEYQCAPVQLSEQRTALVANSHFVLERLRLDAGTRWQFEAIRETWLLGIEGAAIAGGIGIARGDAIFAQDQTFTIEVGDRDLDCLVAYTGLGGLVDHLIIPMTTDGVLAKYGGSSGRPWASAIGHAS